MDWKKANSNKYGKLYTSYTLAFIMAAIVVFSFFYYYEKSMVWDKDGLYQHYNAFLYLGTWCRGIIRSLIFDHKLLIPLWEWGLGYGADIITTLGYYTFGDIFALVSVITPEKYAEVGYTISIVLRFYAAGFAFCAYAKKMGCRSWAIVCASVMYTFCSYAIFSGVRHPYFILPMIYLPLVWLGCEKIIRGESALQYILAVFLAAFSNFYFFYVIVLLTILYVVIRLFSEQQYRDIKILGKYLLQFIGFGILGLAMASVVFLPNALSFLLGNSRINDAYKFSLFYSREEYKILPGSAIAPYYAVSWGYIGMAPLAYMGVGACFLQKKEDKWAKWYLAAEVLFLLFPAAGYVFNGMGYVCNRWVFAWSLVVAFMFAKFFPIFPCLERKKKVMLSVGCILYSAVCLFLEEKHFNFILMGVALLLASVVFIWFICDTGVWNIGKFRVSKARFFYAVTFLLAITNVYVLAEERFVGKGYINQFVKNANVDEKLSGEYEIVKKSVKDESFYRIDRENYINYKISCGQSTTNFFWSLLNPNVDRFVQDNSAHLRETYNSKGLCSRSLLLPLVGAKYLVARSGDRVAVPYGYENISKESDLQIYKTENFLPIGYTYDKSIPLEEYEKMTIAEKQQAMLQGAVIADDEAAKLEKCVPVYEDENISYEVTCGDNTEFDGHTLLVKSRNSVITLSTDSPVDGELYVELSGVHFQSKSSYDSAEIEKEKTFVPKTATLLRAYCDGVGNRVYHYTEYNKYAMGTEDYLLNLGYLTKKRTKVKLKFSEEGIYTIDDIKVICQHMTHYNNWIKDLQNDVLENVQMTTNCINGTIHLEKEKLLCLSVPYSKGWSAYVDGKKTDLLCTNIMLSGIMLEPGFHSIELVYRTPYLAAGFFISILGIVITIFLWIFQRFWKRTD